MSRKLDHLEQLLAPGPWYIEADAGTGKTHTITSLAVFLVALEGIPLERFLIVTYTNKASAELRERLRLRLDEAIGALSNESGLRDAALAELIEVVRKRNSERQALDNLRRARRELDLATVSTIHSFCQQALARWPVLFRRFEPAQFMEDAGPLRDELVDDYLSSGLYEPAESDLADKSVLTRDKLMTIATELSRHRKCRILPELPGPETRQANPAPGLAGVEFAHWFRQELQHRLEQRRLLTYDDLLLLVEKALADEQSAPPLTERLRRAFPVVLIDEFQDTDLVQWNIFRRGWLQGWQDQSTVRLYLVGDPKQSIYAFRGADVYVCAHAKNGIPPERHFHLSDNWRSDRAYLESLNLLLLGDDSRQAQEDRQLFDLPEFITLRPARYPEEKDAPADSLIRNADGAALAPLAINWLAIENEKVCSSYKPCYSSNKSQFTREVPELVAADIAQMLAQGLYIWAADASGPGKKPGAWRPLEPRDIAVLAQKNAMVEQIAACLRKRKIAAVTSTTASVFHSEAARIMLLWLEAVLQPSRSSPARALAVTPLCGFTARDLAAGADEQPDDGSRLQGLLQDIAGWAEQLQAGRVSLVMRRVVSGWLLRQKKNAHNPRFMKHPQAERLLTDWLHLCELIHQVELSGHASPEALRQWLLEQRAKDGATASDEAQLRLETDANAVQLLTVHKAKGLQFPVVFLPDFWEGKKTPSPPATFHARGQDSNRAAAELSLLVGSDSATNEDKRQIAREAIQEHMRLLYVALTRARHHCRLYYAPVGTYKKNSSLGLLLAYRGQAGVASLEQARDSLTGSKNAQLSDASYGTVAKSLQDYWQRIGKMKLSPRRPTRTAAVPKPQPPPAAPEISGTWQVHSFSSLSRGGRIEDPEREEQQHDDPDQAPDAPAQQGTETIRQAPGSLGAGRKFGNWVHAVLEQVSFAVLARDDPGKAARRQVEQLAWQHGLLLGGRDAREVSDLLELLRRAVTTPLGAEAGDLTLAALSPQERLHELRFALPLAGGTDWHPQRTALAGDEFWNLVSEAAAQAAGGHALDLRPPRRGNRLAGLLYGAIDLVFRHESTGGPRYYLADFKSNSIAGNRPASFGRENLHRLMLEHHYYLQAVLYALAWHRHLDRSLPDYQPRRDFGGVFYLFLRGMQGPDTPPGQGVLFLRPPEEALRRLDEFIDGKRS